MLRYVLAAPILVLVLSCSMPASAQPERDAEALLDQLIDQAIDAEKPFLTSEERVVIERACGYAPGSWDGSQINIIGDVFYCTNGRRVASPEVREVMKAAGPRIDAIVDRAKARPEIKEAARRLDAIIDAREDARAER